MITMDSIPRDASGLVKGEFFLRYASDSFSENIGRVAFRNGRSVNKVGGRDLLRIVAAVGPDLSFEAEAEAATAPTLKPEPTTAAIIGIPGAPAFTTAQAEGAFEGTSLSGAPTAIAAQAGKVALIPIATAGGAANTALPDDIEALRVIFEQETGGAANRKWGVPKLKQIILEEREARAPEAKPAA